MKSLKKTYNNKLIKTIIIITTINNRNKLFWNKVKKRFQIKQMNNKQIIKLLKKEKKN